MSKVFKMVKSQISKCSTQYNINKNVSTILQAPNNIIQTKNSDINQLNKFSE